MQNVVQRTCLLIMISYYVMGFAIEAFTNTVLNHLCGKKIVIFSAYVLGSVLRSSCWYLQLTFLLVLISVVPPDDESWLCPGCDCKDDSLDLLNDSLGTKLLVSDSWEVYNYIC